MASEITYQRLNPSIAREANFSPVWQPRRASALGGDVRIKRQSRPYWEGDYSGAQLNEAQKDNLLGMIWRNAGMVKPILVPVPTFCEIGIITDHSDGEPIVTPAPLCVGDGDTMSVQLQKRLMVDGYEEEFFYYDVKFPYFDYPAQFGQARTIAGPVPFDMLQEITIYENGEPMVEDDFIVGKTTGIVTLPTIEDAVYTVTGGFYILMLMPNKIPMRKLAGGLYEVSEGITLQEPYGGF